MKALRGANIPAGAAKNHSTPSFGPGLSTTAGWCPARCSHGWTTEHVGPHLQVGPATATRTNRTAGLLPGSPALLHSTVKPVGLRRTATAAPTCSSSPGPGSSDTRWSPGTASPDDPTLADYWARRRRTQAHHPWTPISLRLLRGPSTVAAQPVAVLLLPRRTRASHPPRMGAVARRHPQSGPQDSDHRPRRAHQAPRTVPSQSNSFTLTASNGAPPSP